MGFVTQPRGDQLGVHDPYYLLSVHHTFLSAVLTDDSVVTQDDVLVSTSSARSSPSNIG
jgi:hypothetical protein